MNPKKPGRRLFLKNGAALALRTDTGPSRGHQRQRDVAAQVWAQNGGAEGVSYPDKSHFRRFLASSKLLIATKPWAFSSKLAKPNSDNVVRIL